MANARERRRARAYFEFSNELRFVRKEKKEGRVLAMGEKRFLQKTREGEGRIFVEKCLEADKIGPRLIVSRICVNRKEAIATVETARLCLNNTR